MALKVEIVSRSEAKWSGEAAQVSVPSVEGEVGILPGRQPLLAILGTGDIRVTQVDGEVLSIPVMGGFCSMDHDVVTVAADYAGDEVAAQNARLARRTGLAGTAAMTEG